MSWVKGSDNAATYPKVMALDSDPEAEDWTLNEGFGFFMRCSLQSGAHLTDYIVDFGTAKMMGNGRHDLLMRQLERAGLVTVKGRGRRRVWTLIDDPEFINIRLRDEIMFERQRKRDNSNPELIVPVRVRDGDSCRYCGKVVSWFDRRSARAGTYEHREPSEAATYETLVVACKGCNSSRQDGRAAFDQAHPLMPPPVEPYYSPSTVRWLASHGASVGDQADTQQVPADPTNDGNARSGTGQGRAGAGREGAEHPEPAPVTDAGQNEPSPDPSPDQN